MYWSFLNKCDTKGNKAVNKMAIDVLNDHFKNLNALDEDDDNDIVFPTNITEYNIELNQDITEAEVLYAVKSLKNNKACGGDLILNEFLKHATVKLMPVFVRIFNIVFHSGIVPVVGQKVIYVQYIKIKVIQMMWIIIVVLLF